MGSFSEAHCFDRYVQCVGHGLVGLSPALVWSVQQQIVTHPEPHKALQDPVPGVPPAAPAVNGHFAMCIWVFFFSLEHLQPGKAG